MKTVIITGASGGIGRALARKFAAEGYLVGVNYNKNKCAAEKLVGEINGELLPFSVTDYSSVDKAITDFLKRYGRIDALINCAGVALPIKTLLDTTEEEFDKVFSVNVKGTVNVIKRVLPEMLSRGGAIINFSSMWGVAGASCEALYAASKAAIIGLTKSLAKEYASAKIRVNAIAAGFIDTPMNDNIVGEDRREAIAEIPIGRTGTPEEVASACFMLAENGFITGEILNISGGEVI